MKTRLLVFAFGSLLLPTAFGQAKAGEFTDTPANHWVYEIISDLKSTGVLVGYPDGLGRFPGPRFNRYELAVTTNAAALRLHGAVVERARANRERALGSDASFELLTRARKKDYVRNASEIVKLVNVFWKELDTLGAEPKGLLGRVGRDNRYWLTYRDAVPGEALKQFRDVPVDHWAAEAVLNLRREGILVGYPDSGFRD